MSDTPEPGTGPAPVSALVEELRAVARAFTADEAATASILETMAEDVRRALAEPLTIFPVAHHSPASAVHMVRLLRARQPKLVFVEFCEDLRDQVEGLRDCTLPVALQAFASEPVGFPPDWAPLAVVAPLTELSAEYQAIAYALGTEGVELVFVDRDVDAVFRWMDPADNPMTPVPDDDAADAATDDDDDAGRLHGEAVGVEVGRLEPSFVEFRDALLQNARMTHFSEWNALYIEEPTIGADTHTYREVMAMVGSLFRRLGSTPHAREEIRRRDRFMWTRIKQTLAARGVDPEDAVFICGAAHTVADDCPEWGTANALLWAGAEGDAKSGTAWKYGFIPSSYGAIELQFGHPRGAVSLAETVWRKAIARWNVVPFTLDAGKSTKSAKAAKAAGGPKPKPKRTAPVPEQLGLRAVLRDPPPLTEADEAELIGWCTRVVADARKHRYLASTADAIAIYETSILLARMRSRRRPSPFDFIDAAQTCLEKGAVPGRRDVRAICHAMLGGDRIGQVGYASLPPLVQDVYDRLAPIGLTAKTTKVVRALMDFDAEPELRACSRLLWRLHWILPDARVARPIMGKLELGAEPRQESWDVRLSGPEQRAVIELGFAGVTVEQVLERRLTEAAFAETARTTDALEAAESCVLLLDQSRLAQTLGERAVHLLAREHGPDDAGEIFERARRLVHHFRAQPQGVPAWLSRFVATGYATYASSLPAAFGDRGTSPLQLGAVLSFVFTLESLALAMGCQRSQLVIAIEQASAQAADPEKLGLLWATQWLVQLRDEAGVRGAFAAVLEHPLGRNGFPRYLSGFLRALAFAPKAAPLAVELLGRAFSVLPDAVLLPWMPGLLTTLREQAIDTVPALMKELARTLPLPGALARWSPPWIDAPAVAVAVDGPIAPTRSEQAGAAHGLLRRFPEATDAWAQALAIESPWIAGGTDVGNTPDGDAARHEISGRS